MNWIAVTLKQYLSCEFGDHDRSIERDEGNSPVAASKINSAWGFIYLTHLAFFRVIFFRSTRKVTG